LIYVGDTPISVIRMNQLIDDLKKLSNRLGVSGFESKVREEIRSRIAGLADEVSVDALGNLLVTKTGKPGGPRILLDAHMDEVGFLVSHIDNRGFLRFEKLGGWDDRTLLGQPVRFETEKGVAEGVIGAKPPHLQKGQEREKVIPYYKMFVDLGARDSHEVNLRGIEVGTPFTLYHPFRLLPGGRAMGKAFDDRVGCAILLEVLRRLQDNEHEATVLFNFSVCEEVGGRGAQTAAYGLQPDLALAIENTAAGDTPGIQAERCPTAIGQGPAITIADKSLVAHPRIVARLKEAARAADKPYQIKKPLYGGTDAGRIATTRAGIPSGVLSVPCRYIHSGLSLLDLSDLESCADLAYSFCTAPT